MTNPLYKEFHKLAQHLLNTYSSQHQIVGAYISGSLAGKTLKENSDLDLNLITNTNDTSQRFFDYHNGIPVDLNIYPKSWFAQNQLPLIEPPVAIELYQSVVINDPEGILEKAKTYLQIHLFTPRHQGAWVKSYLNGAKRQLQKTTEAIAAKDWTETLITLHNATIRFGLTVGYLSKNPPNPVTNLIKISEASKILEVPQIYESCKQIYALPSQIRSEDLHALRKRVSIIHDEAVQAIVASGKGDEEKRDANQLSPVRPSRWEFLERKLDQLAEGPIEHAYSGIVWAACDLVRLTHQRIPKEMCAYQKLQQYLTEILSVSNMNSERAIQNTKQLTESLNIVEDIAKKGNLIV